MNADYDAIVDSGASHNFVSQALFDRLQNLQKDSTASEVCLGDLEKLRVTLADSSQAESHQRAIIKVNLDSEQFMH